MVASRCHLPSPDTRTQTEHARTDLDWLRGLLGPLQGMAKQVAGTCGHQNLTAFYCGFVFARVVAFQNVYLTVIAFALMEAHALQYF